MNDPAEFSPVIVAPTFNNAPMLRDVIDRIVRRGIPLVVVNDGSTDQTRAILEEVAAGAAVEVIDHPHNRGKARALLSGFDVARRRGYSHAVTIDTDGQLDPEEIPRLLEEARRYLSALIIGTRDQTASDYPARSRIGRRISNRLVRMESGLRISDSQCGFRVYPLDLAGFLHCRAGRYGYETEVLTRAAWAGAEVREIGVSCTYLAPGRRISHFQPWRDSLRAAGMHARLLARRLMPWPHQRWRSAPAAMPRSWLGHMVGWLSPVRAWRELRGRPMAARELASGVAVGVFIGNLPIYGAQTLLSLYAARRLNLHPLAVVAGSHVSTPPIGALLIALSIGMGHWILHGSWLSVSWGAWAGGWRAWSALAARLIVEWSIGSLVVGAVLAAMAFLISHALLRWFSPAQ